MSFEEVAKDVIKNSIRSAVCIDDRYPSAYEEDNEYLNKKEAKELYDSFRRDGLCDLDIYRFTNLQDCWTPGKRQYIIANKDLLILDWELDPGNGYESTLTILRDVIESKRIPFIVIYTNTQKLKNIGKELFNNFRTYHENVFLDYITKVTSQLACISEGELEEDDIKEIFIDNSDFFYEYIISKNQSSKNDFVNELKSNISFRANINDQAILRKLEQSISRILGTSISDCFRELAKMVLAQDSDYYTEHVIDKIGTEELAFKIDGTIILVYQKAHNLNSIDDKKRIEPDKLFTTFSEAIVRDPHNFLNILSLELKDRLREKFSVIGTEFAKIGEKAFFYHLENYRNLNNNSDLDLPAIYDFVLKSWTEELYQQQVGDELDILLYADEHKQKVDLDISIESNNSSSEESKKLLGELVHYASYISTVKVVDRCDKKLRFGDLFTKEGSKDEFYLCITPLCDCLHPEDKIDNNFYFVKGFIPETKKALEEAETGFYSFIVLEDDPICIEWKCKPFTTHVENNNIDNIQLYYRNKAFKLSHITVLKQNYAQRISNQAFGYGHRVGVDYPRLKTNF